MAPYNFDEERKKIGEYEARADFAERRGPTQKFERPEPEGWAQIIRDSHKSARTIHFGLSNEQLKRLKDTKISDKQLEWHANNQIEVDDDGNIVMIYLRHGITLPWDEQTGEEILQALENNTKTFMEHYPPTTPTKDRRFKDAFEQDKKRCKDAKYWYGVYHLGLRREKGNFQQIPAICDETIDSRHHYLAAYELFKALTPIKQTLGMLYSICFPKEYELAQKIVQHWSEESGLKALVHTPREFATYLALNANTISEPHTDLGDSEDVMTVMHSWGTFDRETGGHLAVPIFNRKYKLYPDSVIFLRASLVLHYVTRWKDMLGERFSMVHITTKDMANFGAVKLPFTPAEKRELQLAAMADDDVTECPFCHKEMAGSPAVNGHLTNMIKKKDKLHPKKEAEEWREEKQKEIIGKRRERSKRKSDAIESDDEEVEDKKKAKAPKAKKVPVSEKYERYGNAL